jgi:hypothetical protein
MIDERIWKIMQKRLGYSDEEQEHFRNNPRNEQVLLKATELANTQFIIEVIESHGCNSRHKKGEKYYLDGYGNLLKEKIPDKLCIFMIGQIQGLVFGAQELIYAGIDPNEMRFNAVGCADVGNKCGGWGKVTMKLSTAKL